MIWKRNKKLLQIFVNVLNYGLHDEIQLLIDHGIYKPLFAMLFHVINMRAFNQAYSSAVRRLFRQFKVDDVGLVLTEIADIAKQYAKTHINVVAEQYAKNIVELVTCIQLELQHLGCDWKLSFPLLFAVA